MSRPLPSPIDLDIPRDVRRRIVATAAVALREAGEPVSVSAFIRDAGERGLDWLCASVCDRVADLRIDPTDVLAVLIQSERSIPS